MLLRRPHSFWILLILDKETGHGVLLGVIDWGDGHTSVPCVPAFTSEALSVG